MVDAVDDLVNTIKGGWEKAADWMSGGPVKRLFEPKPKGEPMKFDGPKEKEEQSKKNRKKLTPEGPKLGGKKKTAKKTAKATARKKG